MKFVSLWKVAIKFSDVSIILQLCLKECPLWEKKLKTMAAVPCLQSYLPLQNSDKTISDIFVHLNFDTQNVHTQSTMSAAFATYAQFEAAWEEVRWTVWLCKHEHFITKTCLFKYTENFNTKKWKFSDKKSWYFLYFCSKHRLWVPTIYALSRNEK